MTEALLKALFLRGVPARPAAARQLQLQLDLEVPEVESFHRRWELDAERLGEAYHEHRRQTMLARQLGLTKTYNLFHNPACTDGDIAQLRELHAALDRAILACYGWTELDPGHGFHANERGQTRYTISPPPAATCSAACWP